MFTFNQQDRPSLQILNALYEHDDFMESIQTLVDLGCGQGEDLEWWASRTTREDNPQPLNIRCYGVDIEQQIKIDKKYPNIAFQQTDFEETVNAPSDLFDVLWCHDSFQYCLNPLQTLYKWRQLASPGAMLILAVPETVQLQRQQILYHLPSKVFYHHSVVSLIYMLAATGWDCRNGFFQHAPQTGWIRAVVYKTNTVSPDYKKTTWYDLIETDLLPETAVHSIKAHGFLKQQDLVVPWLDHNLTWMGNQ